MKIDVLCVQILLDAHAQGPGSKLTIDGLCGPLTIASIFSFQEIVVKLSQPDGKITPNGPTFRALCGHSVRKHMHSTSGAFPAPIVQAAQSAQGSWMVPASVTLAQWVLESNWGRDMPLNSNNPFGIKAVGNEAFVSCSTSEVIGGRTIVITAKFRKFASLAAAFDAHGRLLATNKAYFRAMMQTDHPDAFARALTGVYATDPSYGEKLVRLMKRYNLYQYNSSDRRAPIGRVA